MSDPAARNAPALASDPAWTAYGDTILVMGNDDILARVDLRRRLTTGMRDLLVTMAGGERFGIVTPHDPGGRTLDDAENAARVRALRDELEREGLPYFRADGQNESGSHVERGFAIVADRETIRGIAGRTEQTAFYWFDGERMWLVPTRPDEAAVALPTTPDALEDHLDGDDGDTP